ncbi:MAG: apolipoprotein N-acyltransferase [Acidobacteriota bacterium]
MRFAKSDRISALVAVVGGAAWGLCFGVESRPWLAWFALAPLFWLLPRRRAWLWGWLFGTAGWLVATPWIASTVGTFGGLPTWLAQVVGVLFAVYLAADLALFALAGGLIVRFRPSWTPWALPALWVAVETLRGLPFGGFPWNLAAYAWADLPGALLLSSWVGAAGVSFLVAAVNVAVTSGVRRRRWRGTLAIWLVAAFALSVAARFAGVDGPRMWGKSVRLIQPNTDVVFDPDTAWQDYVALIDASLGACDEPALIVWPESAAWPLQYFSTARLQDDIARLVERGCPVILGSAVKSQDGILNAAILVGPDGVGEPYAKRRLVPFGEYVPLGDLLPFIGNLARQAGDFTPGTEPTLLQWGSEKLGMAICYEVVFPSPVAEHVRAGATVLTTITNDAWYGDSTAPPQHLRAAQFRAAENRRPMLRAALTGITAVIDAEGRVVESLGVTTSRQAPGVIRARVSGRTDTTLYTRAPWLVPAVCWALSLFAIIRAALDRRRAVPPTSPQDPAISPG